MSIENLISNLTDALEANTKALLASQNSPTEVKTPTKKKAAAKKKAAEPVEEVVEPEVEEPEEVNEQFTGESEDEAKPKLTKDDLKKALGVYHGKHGKTKSLELIGSFGANKLSDLKEVDYQSLYDLAMGGE